MKIMLTCLTFDITEVGRQRWFRYLMFLAHFLDYALQLRAAASRLVFLDGTFDCLLKLVGSIGEMFHSFCLIYVGHLFAKVT